jgi:hypothetical protein
MKFGDQLYDVKTYLQTWNEVLSIYMNLDIPLMEDYSNPKSNERIEYVFRLERWPMNKYKLYSKYVISEIIGKIDDLEDPHLDLYIRTESTDIIVDNDIKAVGKWGGDTGYFTTDYNELTTSMFLRGLLHFYNNDSFKVRRFYAQDIAYVRDRSFLPDNYEKRFMRYKLGGIIPGNSMQFGARDP